jgi:hypothetical protein
MVWDPLTDNINTLSIFLSIFSREWTRKVPMSTAPDGTCLHNINGRIAAVDTNISLPVIAIQFIASRWHVIGADTGGMRGIDPPTFIPALLVLLFLGGLSPRKQKIF